MRPAPTTVKLRGRDVVVTAEALEAELERSGPIASLAHVEAVVRAADRARAVARLRRAVAAGEPGVQTREAAMGLVRLDAKEGAAELRGLAARLGGLAGALATAAAFLVEDRVEALAAAVAGDPLLLHASPQAWVYLPRVPAGAACLHGAWIAALAQAAPHLGSTAYRAFLGDVCEAIFRSLQRAGETPEALLDEAGRAFLVDALCAELPGTTDFLAARGMTWLAGALAPSEDAVRSAVERARARFRAEDFQADCEAILSGQPWPPRLSRGGRA